MDFGLTITAFSTARGKLRKSQMAANAGEEDIISSKLPESLISHILSLLPTKDAVRTCLLSKVWKDRWASVTKLDLHDTVVPFSLTFWEKGPRQNFANFVNRALVLTDGSTMELFSLAICGEYDASLLDAWTSNILKRRVKNLHIFSYFEFPFSALASHYLFNSTLLEELVLGTISTSTIKVSTNSVHFGHLKLLKLCGIIFNTDSSAAFLTLSLPVLKKFEAKNCSWFTTAMGVSVTAPLLESISIEQDITTASDLRRSCFIRFRALHPKEFTYCGYGITQAIFLRDFNLPSLSPCCCASAKIILNRCKNKYFATRANAFLLLGQCSQAKCIKFEGSEILPDPEVAQERVPALPVFAMLSHLELGFAAVEVLLGLLRKSPVLKTLVLKVVKLEQVNGDEHELFLAKFFMENGMMLERMSFSFASQRLGKSKVMEEEFKGKLYSFKKGFPFAIVEFLHD